jgi:hypothetical protein
MFCLMQVITGNVIAAVSFDWHTTYYCQDRVLNNAGLRGLPIILPSYRGV